MSGRDPAAPPPLGWDDGEVYTISFVADGVEDDDALAWERLDVTRAVDGPLNLHLQAFQRMLETFDEDYDLRPMAEVIGDGFTASRILCAYGRDHIDIDFMHEEPVDLLARVIALAHAATLVAFDHETKVIHRGDGYAGTVMKVEDRPFLVAPRWDQVSAAVRALTPDGGPSFLVVEKQDACRRHDDYIQTAGGDGAFVVETREYAADRFRHWRAGYPDEPARGRASVLTNGFHVPVRRNEKLATSDVDALLRAFLDGEGRAAGYGWRDMSAEFSG